MSTRLQIIGGGKMGLALALALYAAGRSVGLVQTPGERYEWLQQQLPDSIELRPDAFIPSLEEQDQNPDLILAVKPNIVYGVLATIARPVRVLSVAAGLTTATIENDLPTGSTVLRAMPNTPAIVGKGITALCGGQTSTAEDLAWATSVLEAIGEVESVDESQMNTVTGVSGSGPAYFFAFVEALEAAAVAEGLDPDAARQLAYQTFIGSAKLLESQEADISAGDLREQVTTPNGTTAAGLSVFEDVNLDDILKRVVVAASSRAAEIGSELR